MAVGGYSAPDVLSALIGLATATWQVGLLGVGAWVARGLRVPARNALLADVTTPTVYGRAYGFERAMDNLATSGVAGLVWTVLSPEVAFVYLAVWMGVALAGFLGFFTLGGDRGATNLR